VPAKYIGDITVSEGKVIAKCAVCGGDAQAVGQLIKFRADGKMLIAKLSDLRKREEDFRNQTGDWNVVFSKYQVASQKLNVNNEHMNGTVAFMIWRQSDTARQNSKSGLIKVRQPSGESHAFTDGPIEVELPELIKSLVNYSEMRDAVEDYIRSLFGGNGLVGVAPGAKGHFKDVSFTNGPSKIYQIKAPNSGSSAW
jgi:hypothetical protein